jgi:histidinol-phosphate aminotransferase
MTAPRFTPLAESLPATVPFVGPEAQERALGQAFRARIGANESVFGPSPKAIEAMAREAAGTWRYADPESHDLKAALAIHHGIEVDCLTIGEGIEGLPDL